MSQKIHFAPGPSQLYPGVDQFISQALEQDVCSISHRSQAFKEIYKNAVTGLRKLVSLPEDWEIVFLPSATEAWDRIIASAVGKQSFHFVNGSFSKKFYQYAVGAGIDALKAEVVPGEGFEIDNIDIPSSVELVCFTHNETSTGVTTPVADINAVSDRNPNALIAVDCVSSLPYPDFDFDKIDSFFFSVQKCFGLPAGLGVWCMNKKFIEKTKALVEGGKNIGAHHNLLDMVKKSTEYQTLETPNVLNIFLFSKVLEDMNLKGADYLREETIDKADLLYKFISESEHFDFAVEKEEHRSKTVIVAKTKTAPAIINDFLAPFGLEVGAGYGDFKVSQIRIANFPAHSKAKIEKLIECLKKYEDR